MWHPFKDVVGRVIEAVLGWGGHHPFQLWSPLWLQPGFGSRIKSGPRIKGRRAVRLSWMTLCRDTGTRKDGGPSFVSVFATNIMAICGSGDVKMNFKEAQCKS